MAHLPPVNSETIRGERPCSLRSRSVVKCRVNPGLRGDQVQNKTDPERSAEKLVRRQARQGARGEKHPDDRADRRHGKTNRKCSDHPLAVKCDFMVPYVPKRFAECVQKECAEQNCGRGLIDAADRLHRETHHQRRRANDQATTYEDAATPTMPAKMTGTNR